VAGGVVIVALCPSYELAEPLGGEPQALPTLLEPLSCAGIITSGA